MKTMMMNATDLAKTQEMPAFAGAVSIRLAHTHFTAIEEAILGYLSQVDAAGESREIAALKASDLATTMELEALPELLASAVA